MTTNEPSDYPDSWWYRVYAAALIFTELVIGALYLFQRTFSG
jgi:hypothetical protein